MFFVENTVAKPPWVDVLYPQRSSKARPFVIRLLLKDRVSPIYIVSRSHLLYWPFPSRPNTKEEKAVWLRETTIYTHQPLGIADFFFFFF